MSTSHLVLVYLWKHKHIKPILKVNKYEKIIFYQSLAPFQYQVMHSIMILKFFAKMIDFIVHFERFLAGRWSTLRYYNFSTPDWELIKCIYETPRQVCVWAMVLRWPSRLICLSICLRSYWELQCPIFVIWLWNHPVTKGTQYLT